MKNTKHFMTMALMALMALGFTGCYKNHSLTVSSQDFRFGKASETQTLIVRTNTKWSIDLKDNADWYTISPLSGSANDSIVTITVNAYDGDYRGTSFVVNSPGGHIHRTVFVAQTKIDVYSMINKVYGVMHKERWNTDFYGQIIEDSYEPKDYNPYDTTRGYQMYFLADGTGVQRDNHADTVAYWLFNYAYDDINHILHISFSVDSTKNYSPEVLTATDSLYRFMHEFEPHNWERADMRKIGTIDPAEKSDMLLKAVKRKHSGPIFLD